MEQKNDTKTTTDRTEVNRSTMNESTPTAEPSINTMAAPKRRRKTLLLPLALILAVLAGFGGATLQEYLATETSDLTVLNAAKNDGNAVVTPGEESIAAVANAVSPSVVSILTSTNQTSRVFGGRAFEQQGAGTGMIVSSNGYILTNKHVVEGTDTVTVILPDGKTYENVDVLGSDPLNDVAFLKIKNVTNLPAITLGDSKTVRIGQTVVAIGNALGQYQNTVTSGIISGTGRPVVASSGANAEDAESLTDLLQTDAAINSGNSGGPLLNLKGQVIGINTAIAEGAQSIGFAIPIGATKGMLNHVIKTGKVERAYLGVQYISITPAVRNEYDLKVNKGDYVRADEGRSVQTNGPADKAGIKDGDIITQVNGSKVGQVASVSSLISEYEPGDKVQITILRDGREQTVTATLGTYRS